jgi:hypothetical protein
VVMWFWVKEFSEDEQLSRLQFESPAKNKIRAQNSKFAADTKAGAQTDCDARLHLNAIAEVTQSHGLISAIERSCLSLVSCEKPLFSGGF